MGMFRRRVVPGNTHVVTSVVAVPDAWSVQMASLGVMTNTFSPASAGIHGSPGASARGYVGIPGYGVNRWAGRTTYPLQKFSAATAPVADPLSQRVGIGSGPSGSSSMPNTGNAAGSGMASSLAAMSYNALAGQGMGG